MININSIFDNKQVANLEKRFARDKYSNSQQKNNNTIIQNIPTMNIDYYIIKPIGKKCYLWFTYIDKQFISIIKFVNDNNFYKVDLQYDNTLSYNNVLLYGYYLKMEGKSFFIIDNIINYNDYNYILNSKSFNIQYLFNIYNIIFKYININNSYILNAGKNNDSNIKIYIPYITDTYNDIFNNIYNLAYKPYGVSLWKKDKNIGLYTFNNNSNIYEGIFQIRAQYNHDTYSLYCNNNNKLEFYSNSLITDYKLSIFMNSLFRNIVENKNLDLLEESDSEDMFENIDENKYVDLDKYYFFKCYYNRRFKKWVPKTLIENAKLNEIITKKQLYYIEKK